jgi:hypothetical protein
MGILFDLVLLLYFGLAIYVGYKRGFLISVSGIVALILSTLIYTVFELDYIYFAIIYIALIVAIVIFSRIIRKLKVPILAKTDAVLGTALGAFNGLVGVIAISALMLAIISSTGSDALDSSFILQMFEDVLPV